MADHTGIEWTDATWNPIVGCSLVSPGCTNCYAMRQASRIALMAAGAGHVSHYEGTTQPSKAGPVWTDKVKLAPDSILTQPLRWRRPRKIFVNSMGDLFHEDVPDEWIDRVFAIMALCPQHTFQVLTKRSARMRAYFSDPKQSARVVIAMGEIIIASQGAEHGPYQGEAARLAAFRMRALDIIGPSGNLPLVLPNVWLGVSTEDQRRWLDRTADLKATPATIRFVSAEPLLGAIVGEMTGIDLVIAGGESGPNARPMHPDWARSLRDQCAAAGTAFFFKQWGAWAPLPRSAPVLEAGGSAIGVAWPDGSFGPGRADLNGGEGTTLYVATKGIAGRLLDGVEHNAMPEVL